MLGLEWVPFAGAVVGLILGLTGVSVGVVLVLGFERIQTLSSKQKTIDKLSGRLRNEIEEIFGIRTNCLKANESQYLIGFRTTDEIRSCHAKAKKEINRRRASKPRSEPFGQTH